MFTLEENNLKKSNILEVKIKNYGECGFCEDLDNQETLKIPWGIWSQWMYISQRMGEKEWGAVFWVKDNTITGFKIPKQEATSVECEFREELGGDGIIHSHHDMGAFHSSQDDAHARNLYVYSIVIANSKGSIATKRVKLPCKGFGYVKISLQLVELPAIDLSKISEKTRELIPGVTSEFEENEYPCDTCQTGDCENCEHLGMPFLACQTCDTFKCKSCKTTAGIDIRGVLPFCELCNSAEICASCERIAKYLKNYPEERGRLQTPAGSQA
ncbi:MAG: Mov34/MPN/PAD-1 family protein [Candidatus Omnitrophota bacterium]